MDFVVVGFGLGALILLVGIAVRDLAPRLRRSRSAKPDGDAELGIYSIQRVSVERWATACQSAGQAIMLGGGAIILATAGGIVAGVDNGDGANLVLAVILVVLGGIAVRLGMLANDLFPIDRRSRERAQQLMERAKPIAAPVVEAPRTGTVVANEAKPEAPVAADVARNGASAEAIPAEIEVQQAEKQAASAAASSEDGGESTQAAEDTPVAEDASPATEADAAQEPAKDVVEATADADEQASNEAASESEAAKENETDEARVPSEVGASGRTSAEA